MKARIVILVLILVGVAGVWAFRDPGDPKVDYDDGNQPTSDGKVLGLTTELARLALPGEDPPVEPEFDVTIEVDTSDGRNKLISRITERHGYFVETLKVDLYFMPTGGTEDDEVRAYQRHVEDYILANDTLTLVDFVVPAELDDFGGSIGESSNWRGEVVAFGRARLEDPAEGWEGFKVRENNRK
jgi:hypothetical protein